MTSAPAYRLIAEAAAWHDYCLRQSDLCKTPASITHLLGSKGLKQRNNRPYLVAGIAHARRRLLRRSDAGQRILSDLSQRPEDLHGGRILIYAPEDSLADGAACEASAGYFDESNAPPWETWLYFFTDERRQAEDGQRLNAQSLFENRSCCGSGFPR